MVGTGYHKVVPIRHLLGQRAMQLMHWINTETANKATHIALSRQQAFAIKLINSSVNGFQRVRKTFGALP